MPPTRRFLLSVVVATPFAVSHVASAQTSGSADPRMSERSIGAAEAKVVVEEYFSLTCGHCAHFGLNILPKVKSELIDTGKMRLVFRDFPLDQLALSAAMVARALPALRYDSFIHALFASQERWAHNRSLNSMEELWKMAALAGMNRATFDATVADSTFKNAILAAQQAASKDMKIASTPSFVIKGQMYAGALSAERLNDLVTGAIN